MVDMMHRHGTDEPHKHPTNLANAPHYHFEGDEDAERFGWAHFGPKAELCTSVHYPPIDGKPDSQDGWAVAREAAVVIQFYGALEEQGDRARDFLARHKSLLEESE